MKFIIRLFIPVCILFCGIVLGNCAIPLVPNPSFAENANLYGKMTLITEINFSNFSPYIENNTKGPELDQTPVLIPAPDNPSQLGWILFPANKTAAGRSIASGNHQDLGMGGSLFGYYLDPTKQKHSIDAASQYNSVAKLTIDLPEAGVPYSRINAFPMNEGANPSRLAILTQGNSIGNSFYPVMYIADQISNCFTDIGSYPSGTFYPSNAMIGYQFMANAIVFNTPFGTGGNVSSPTIAGDIPIGTFPYPNRSSVFLVCSTPLGTNYSIRGYNFNPVIATGTGTNSSATSIYVSPTTTFNKALHSYVCFDPASSNIYVSLLTSGAAQPYLMSTYVGGIYNENPMPYPIVRTLQDGTTLALVGNAWCKVISFDPGTGLPTALSQPIPTGSMIFDYDYSDGNGVKWMVFSETFVQSVPPDFLDNNNKDNLVMRAWRIKQSDLIP